MIRYEDMDLQIHSVKLVIDIKFEVKLEKLLTAFKYIGGGFGETV
jgi:hypothetical protein